MLLPWVWKDLHLRYSFMFSGSYTPQLVQDELDSFQNVVMQSPYSNNDVNFLVFNIKVCIISLFFVRSLNWANYAFHTSYSAFYQVAAAQDKLVSTFCPT